MAQTSREIRESIEKNWNEHISKYGNLFSSDKLSGSTPPSVFIGSYNYPKVFVGPMVPPIHGDTSLLDMPEKWQGKTLEEIVNFRLNLIRGIKKISIFNSENRYVENLQEMTMASKPTDSDIDFYKTTSPVTSIDGESAPFGPVGEIKSIKFSNQSSEKSIEKTYYDKDLNAANAILNLYNNGIEISKIQKCFSIGMFGKHRKLVPTRWSITATDDIISNSLVENILDYSMIDSCQVFSYEHLGNIYSVILFPHRWIFEMQEAWHSGQTIGFGADHEDARGISNPPSIAGAYFAGKLGVAEYLENKKIQAGVIILREIRPEYAIPVGVWQVREGIRTTMNQIPKITATLNDGIKLACTKMSISEKEWQSHGDLFSMIKQKTISDFF